MGRKVITNLIILFLVLIISGQRETAFAQNHSSISSLSWERIDTSDMPSPRYGFALTLNPNNQLALMFGGLASEAGPLNELWLTNGSQWLEFSTPRRPTERAYSSLTYDTRRQEAILFGGGSRVSGMPVYLNDTWVFNGVDWIEQRPESSPSPRAGASIVYHPVLQRVYLFGGSYSVEDQLWKFNDTWAWDGSNWQQITLDTQPAIRDSAAIAYDPVHQNVILYGGVSIGAPLTDTWIWDGEAWAEQHPVNQPSDPFEYPLMVFDEKRQQILLVGTRRDFTNTQTQTWAWNGQDWSQLPVARPLPPELMINGKLVYLPSLQTTALVSTFTQKHANPDGSIFFMERSEVWALVERHFDFLPLISH